MSWRVVARKEFMEHLRNYWVLTTSAIFLALMLVASGIVTAFVTLGADLTLAGIRPTIGTMRFIATVIVPILSLMLGYAAIAGERESGSLALIAAQPITRAQIMLGKFAGLWAVLATALVAGIGVGGIVIVGSAQEGLVGLHVLAVFLVETVIWGAAWTSITLLISASFKHRSTAAAGAVLVWFLFAIIWVPATALIVASTSEFATSPAGAPRWLLLLELLNPNGVYAGLVARTLQISPGAIGEFVQAVLPLDATALTYFVVLLAWIALPLVGAYVLFRRRDV